MSNPISPFGGFRAVSRKAIRLSDEALVQSRPLEADRPLPLLVEPAAEGVDLVAWAAAHRAHVQELVDRHGGVLFRGFGLSAVEDFNRFIEAVDGGALEYTERSSPRSQVSGNIYTSTDYPPDQRIFLHNEQSYNLVFPLRIFFFCVTPAEIRGETPIADCRRILARIDPEVRRRFEDGGYVYVRNFGDGLGLPWETAFQTRDRGAVEAYCREHGIEAEWKDGNRLRTRQRRRVAARHPRTGEQSWFNHLTFFHVSTLAPAVREALERDFAPEELPNNTYYGDGSPIEPEVMAHLQGLYEEETQSFPWQRGDLLMLDNTLTAHGRSPFTGARRVVVGMAEPTAWDDV